MNWRTDKPTADVIVAKLSYPSVCGYEILIRLDSGEYCNQYDVVPTKFITKWADLEEDNITKHNALFDQCIANCDPETMQRVSDEGDLENEVADYFQGYWPGTETAEQCNTDMHFTPLAIMRLAEHFAKWGAEHLKK